MECFDVIVVGAGPAGFAAASKCTKLGFTTLLLEKGEFTRHKPCGGVIPTLCADMLEEEFGATIPPEVMSFPNRVGLFYVPPSGRKNSGTRRNYDLLNVDRDLFDRWLCKTAEGLGVQVLYEAEFKELQRAETIRVFVKEKEGEKVIEFKTRFLVGADGVFSQVKRQIHPDFELQTLNILQEYWQAKGDFDEKFYAFFRGEISPCYAYLIPKNGLFLIGTGAPKEYSMSLSKRLESFKEWLGEEFAFEPVSLEGREVGVIPYHSLFSGEGDVILVGDAAGFCNPFSGEGIRLAIKSGIEAGEAIEQARHGSKALSLLYAHRVNGLNQFIHNTYEFNKALTDMGREKFVRSQIFGFR